MSAYHEILVAVDGSPTSERALQEAIRFAQTTGAHLSLMHVVDELSYVNGFESAMAYVGETEPLMRDAGERLLRHDIENASEMGVRADSVLVCSGAGRIYEHVAEQARHLNADLIVIGSHGRRGVGRLLLGSDAEQILRHAPTPVLVVRAASAEAT